MRFVLACEGSSDAPLTIHIQRLLVECGFAHPHGDVVHQGSRIADKINKALALAGALDLVFVHRDANNVGAQARHQEIAQAVGNALPDGVCHVG